MKRDGYSEEKGQGPLSPSQKQSHCPTCHCFPPTEEKEAKDTKDTALGMLRNALPHVDAGDALMPACGCWGARNKENPVSQAERDVKAVIHKAKVKLGIATELGGKGDHTPLTPKTRRKIVEETIKILESNVDE